LNISGSSTVGPIAQVSVNRFQTENPGTTINLTISDSGTGMADLMGTGVDDIAMSSSACTTPTGTTVATCNDVTSNIIALDAVSIIINQNLPCAAALAAGGMTEQTIQQIWTSTHGTNILNWNQVPGCGSVNHTITIVNREAGSGTRGSIEKLSNFSEADLQAKSTATGAHIGNQSTGMETAVNGDTYAIGYAGLHFVGAGNEALPLSWISYHIGGTEPGICGADLVSPTDDTVKNSCYPMWRNLYLFTLNALNTKPLIQKYLTWVTSFEGQAVVQDEGYVAVGPQALDSDVNMDGVVDISDVGAVGLKWNQSNSVPGWIRADVNYDGVIDISDVGTIGLAWGATTSNH